MASPLQIDQTAILQDYFVQPGAPRRHIPTRRHHQPYVENALEHRNPHVESGSNIPKASRLSNTPPRPSIDYHHPFVDSAPNTPSVAGTQSCRINTSSSHLQAHRNSPPNTPRSRIPVTPAMSTTVRRKPVASISPVQRRGIPRKPVGSPSRRREGSSATTIVHHTDAIESSSAEVTHGLRYNPPDTPAFENPRFSVTTPGETTHALEISSPTAFLDKLLDLSDPGPPEKRVTATSSPSPLTSQASSHPSLLQNLKDMFQAGRTISLEELPHIKLRRPEGASNLSSPLEMVQPRQEQRLPTTSAKQGKN